VGKNVSIDTAAEWLQAFDLPDGFEHSLEHYLEQVHALAELTVECAR
jgi:hypothetical protein